MTRSAMIGFPETSVLSAENAPARGLWALFPARIAAARARDRVCPEKRGVLKDDGFARAIVDTIREPLLVLDKDLRVLRASRSFCAAFHVEGQDVQGRPFHELGGGAWNLSDLRSQLALVAPEDTVIDGYQVEHDFPTIGRRVILLNARKIFYESHATDAILVAIEDVTDRRAAERERDDLLLQKDMLLGEMQHRVANSLQIIASILLMKARSVSSEETRQHLEDAHKRVLAVAAVQRHLHASTGPEAIELKPYLTELCASLGSAMIRENDIKLSVELEGGRTSSAAAVSLGLIVTELVINALKHAFPEEKADASIVVTYSFDKADWTLTVSDNGIGKQDHGAQALTKSGLGTVIVNALAQQLSAHVATASGVNGTRVSVSHTEGQDQ